MQTKRITDIIAKGAASYSELHVTAHPPAKQSHTNMQLCEPGTPNPRNSEHTKPPVFIPAQSVDGAFLASATRCPTSRIAERLAKRGRPRCQPTNTVLPCASTWVAEENRLKTPTAYDHSMSIAEASQAAA